MEDGEAGEFARSVSFCGGHENDSQRVLCGGGAGWLLARKYQGAAQKEKELFFLELRENACCYHEIFERKAYDWNHFWYF